MPICNHLTVENCKNKEYNLYSMNLCETKRWI